MFTTILWELFKTDPENHAYQAGLWAACAEQAQSSSRSANDVKQWLMELARKPQMLNPEVKQHLKGVANEDVVAAVWRRGEESIGAVKTMLHDPKMHNTVRATAVCYAQMLDPEDLEVALFTTGAAGAASAANSHTNLNADAAWRLLEHSVKWTHIPLTNLVRREDIAARVLASSVFDMHIRISAGASEGVSEQALSTFLSSLDPKEIGKAGRKSLASIVEQRKDLSYEIKVQTATLYKDSLREGEAYPEWVRRLVGPGTFDGLATYVESHSTVTQEVADAWANAPVESRMGAAVSVLLRCPGFVAAQPLILADLQAAAGHESADKFLAHNYATANFAVAMKAEPWLADYPYTLLALLEGSDFGRGYWARGRATEEFEPAIQLVAQATEAQQDAFFEALLSLCENEFATLIQPWALDKIDDALVIPQKYLMRFPLQVVTKWIQTTDPDRKNSIVQRLAGCVEQVFNTASVAQAVLAVKMLTTVAENSKTTPVADVFGAIAATTS